MLLRFLPKLVKYVTDLNNSNNSISLAEKEGKKDKESFVIF